jgi:hypothetical protein
MISETAFSQHYSSTWRLLAPAIDLYVRKINFRLYEREFAVSTSETLPKRRGFINEIAFTLFCSFITGRETDIAGATAIAKKKIAELKTNVPPDLSSLSELETTDCREQFDRLQLFFRRVAVNSNIEVFPLFSGAGIINTCEGDLFFGETLFEVKAGQRMFRAVDIKQLLTYAALNHASAQRKLTKAGLFNPRMGISFSASLDEVSLETSGCHAAELLPEIIRVISSGDVSR